MVTSPASWAIARRGKLSPLWGLWKGCFFILLLLSLLANFPGKLAINANEITISVGKCDPRIFESSKPHLTVLCIVCTLYSFETCLFIQCNIYLKSICPKARHWLMKLPTLPLG